MTTIENETAETVTIRGNAWLIDADYDLWVLVGAAEDGTGTAAYRFAEDAGSLTAETHDVSFIEAHHGIAARGPLGLFKVPRD